MAFSIALAGWLVLNQSISLLFSAISLNCCISIILPKSGYFVAALLLVGGSYSVAGLSIPPPFALSACCSLSSVVAGALVAVAKSSVMKHLKNGNKLAAADAFLLWNKANHKVINQSYSLPTNR